MKAIELNKRDLREINNNLRSIMNDTRRLYYQLTDEDYNAIENALLESLKAIKIKNKQKFTPKKYRK